MLSIIKGSVIIAQSWGDEQLFVTLKNILEFHEIEKIYAYPSNIKDCTDALTSSAVRINIELLNSTLTISSDRCPYHGIPEQIFLQEGTVKPKKTLNDKFSYYLDDDNNIKDIDHFQALQIGRDADLESIKKIFPDLELLIE